MPGVEVIPLLSKNVFVTAHRLIEKTLPVKCYRVLQGLGNIRLAFSLRQAGLLHDIAPDKIQIAASTIIS